MRILAIIPAFNEQDCIEETVQSLQRACPDVDYLIVNDGSTDATGRLCDELGLSHIDLPVNCGLSAGFQTGMKHAERNDYDAALQFDADGQHLPEYIPAMAKAMQEQHADIVIASRILAGERLGGARGLGSHLISTLIRLTCGVRITDPTSGMRMYSRRLIKLFAESRDLSPEPDTIALFARKGAVVIEVPAHMQERQGGRSYLDLPHVLRYMLHTCSSILIFQWFGNRARIKLT
ncbi:MAG: glycosyltransferase family 2 protein [Atopobiaceae bacterium]|nr:glycosyltransferase family 2 protein [Atopobiaceae bacterium]